MKTFNFMLKKQRVEDLKLLMRYHPNCQQFIHLRKNDSQI